MTQKKADKMHALLKELLALLTDDNLSEEIKNGIIAEISDDISNRLVASDPAEAATLMKEIFSE